MICRTRKWRSRRWVSSDGKVSITLDTDIIEKLKEMAEEEVSLPSANKEDVPQVKVAEPEAKKEEEALGDFLA